MEFQKKITQTRATRVRQETSDKNLPKFKGGPSHAKSFGLQKYKTVSDSSKR